VKCKQKDKLKTKCEVCGMKILLAPHMEARRGHICPNCFRKKVNKERYGLEEPPKNVRKESLLKLKAEMEALKDLPIEEYKKIFEEKIEYLKAHTAQKLHILEGHEHIKKKTRKKLRKEGKLIIYPPECS
jgi:hypothetical protein